MAHLGRPKGKRNEDFSLKPVADYMSKLLGEEVVFIENFEDKKGQEKLANLKNGQIALLENIRFYKEEEAKDDDINFARKLAALGDFYVNDAFGAAHRNHSSTSKVAQILKPAVSGLLMEKEIRCLSQALDNPERPFTAVVGGGDSVKAAKQYQKENDFTHISTGGGASLEFMEGKILPGVNSLDDKE